MTYEWDEEIPQPKPPTNRVRLAFQTWCVEKFDPNSRGEQEPEWGMSRDATLADIARALGVSEAALEGFVKHKHLQDMAARPPVDELQNGNAYMYGPIHLAQGGIAESQQFNLSMGIPKKPSDGGKSG